MEEFTKDPDAVKDYAVDWTEWLAGDTIATSEWTLPDGITQDSEDNTDTVATVFLAGGTDGESYVVTNRITTAAGRTEDFSVTVHVKESSEAAAATTDADLIAAIDAEIASNPGGVTAYELRDGRRVERMDLNQLLKARGALAAREYRRTEGMFTGTRFRAAE